MNFDDILLVGFCVTMFMVLGVVIIMLWSYRYDECINMGHTKLYCLTNK